MEKNKGICRNYGSPVISIICILIICAVFSTGCVKKGLFTCNPDNLVGIKQVDFNNGAITLVFDKKKAMNGDMKSLFENDGEESTAEVWTSSGREPVGKDDIKVDKEKMTVKIMTGVVTGSSIIKISLESGNKVFTLFVEEGKLESTTKFYEGESGPLMGDITTSFSTYTQTYDKKSDSWSEPEYSSEEVTIWQ